MEQIIAQLLLPVGLMMLLATIVGVKPDIILKVVFDLVGVILKVTLELTVVLIRLLGEALILAIVSSKIDERFRAAALRASRRPQKVKVEVMEDKD